MLHFTSRKLAGVAGVAVIAAASSVTAKIANPDLIPAKAAIVVSVPDASAVTKAANANSLISAIDKELTPFIKEKLDEEGASDKIKSLEKVLGFELTPSNVLGTFKSLELYVVPGASEDDTVAAAVVSVADKKRADQLVSLASMAVAEAVSGSEDSAKKATPEKYEGVEISSYGEDDAKVYVGRTNTLILISNQESEVKALADRLKSKPSDSIGSNDDFKKVSEKVTANGGEVFFYSNPEALNTLMESVGNDNPFSELTKKLQPVKFSGGNLKMEPKAISSYSAGVLGEGGLADFMKKNPGAEIDSVNFATQDSLLYLGTSIFDTKAIKAGIDELAASIPGGEEYKAQVEQAEQAVGFSIEKDLIPAIGNELALVVNKVDLDSGPLPSVDAGLVIKVGDEDKLKKVISAVEKLSGLGESEALETSKVGGAEVKFIPAPIPTLQPGFTIHNGYLIIGTTKDGIANLLSAKSGKGNLAGSDKFKSLAPRVGTKGQSLSYVNVSGLASLGLKFAKDKADGDADALAAIKKAETVFKTIGALGGVQSVEDGLLVSDSILSLN